MATSAKKTAVKKSAKSTTASRASTTTTKPSVKKSEVAKADVPEVKAAKSTKKPAKTTKDLSPMDKLRSFHVTSVGAYLLFAAAALFLAGKNSVELLWNVQTRDLFAATDKVLLGPASEVIVSVEYRFLVAAVMVLTAVSSLILASKLKKQYAATVKSEVSGYRWLTIGVTSAVSIELASLLAGVQDIFTLKVVGALVLAAAIFGWLCERENQGSKSRRLLGYYAGIIFTVVAFIPMLASIVGTTVFGDERFGWHVYALGAVLLGGSLMMFRTLKTSLVNKAMLEYSVYELRFFRIDQIVKLLTVVILVVAFSRFN